jgi:hypothetical protein
MALIVRIGNIPSACSGAGIGDGSPMQFKNIKDL